MAYKPLILIACQIKLLLAGSTPSGCYLPPAARRPKAIFRDALIHVLLFNFFYLLPNHPASNFRSDLSHHFPDGF